MAQHNSGDEASVAGGSTEVPLELGAHESALAATAASVDVVEVAVMGSAAVCAVSAASAAFAKRLSIMRCAENLQNYLTSDMVLGCSGVVNLKWCLSHIWRYLTDFSSINGPLRAVKGTEERHKPHVDLTRHCGKSPVTMNKALHRVYLTWKHPRRWIFVIFPVT